MTSEENKFYVYLYLREEDSDTAKAGTPYYVGKGFGNRAYTNNGRSVFKPRNPDNIVFAFRDLTEDESFVKEKELIAQYGREDLKTGILRNRTDGGEGPSGVVVKDSTKKLLSEKNTGRKMTPKQCKKLSKSKTGSKASMETRSKMSTSRIGIVCLPDTRKKISISTTGRKVTEKTRKKQAESQINMLPELRNKIIEAGRLANGKKVKIGEIIYPSLTVASKQIGIKYSTMIYQIKSKKIKAEYL